MKRRKLGATGVNASAIGLGCMPVSDVYEAAGSRYSINESKLVME